MHLSTHTNIDQCRMETLSIPPTRLRNTPDDTHVRCTRVPYPGIPPFTSVQFWHQSTFFFTIEWRHFVLQLWVATPKHDTKHGPGAPLRETCLKFCFRGFVFAPIVEPLKCEKKDLTRNDRILSYFGGVWLWKPMKEDEKEEEESNVDFVCLFPFSYSCGSAGHAARHL